MRGIIRISNKAGRREGGEGGIEEVQSWGAKEGEANNIYTEEGG